MTPRILGLAIVGMVVPLMVSCSWVLCSLVSGEKRVAVDLSGFNCRLFSMVHVYIWSR